MADVAAAMCFPAQYMFEHPDGHLKDSYEVNRVTRELTFNLQLSFRNELLVIARCN